MMHSHSPENSDSNKKQVKDLKNKKSELSKLYASRFKHNKNIGHGGSNLTVRPKLEKVVFMAMRAEYKVQKKLKYKLKAVKVKLAKDTAFGLMREAEFGSDPLAKGKDKRKGKAKAKTDDFYDTEDINTSEDGDDSEEKDEDDDSGEINSTKKKTKAVTMETNRKSKVTEKTTEISNEEGGLSNSNPDEGVYDLLHDQCCSLVEEREFHRDILAILSKALSYFEIIAKHFEK
ncbi:hypothetical protein J3Q64DRAFT_1693291 [Phycomyces blakesleeanus]